MCCPYHKDAGSGSAGAAASSAAGPPPMKRARVEKTQCDWTGNYGDLLAKHLPNDCAVHPVPCPDGCGEKLKRSELKAHSAECVKRLEECEICGAKMKPKEMAAHK